MEPVDKEKLLIATRRKLDDAGVLLVEGLHDERALREIGVSAPIVKANQRADLVAQRAMEVADNREAVLLFDFDHEGERKMRECQSELRSLGVKCDSQSRVHLQWLTGIKHIEELPSALQELHKRFGVGFPGGFYR